MNCKLLSAIGKTGNLTRNTSSLLSSSTKNTMSINLQNPSIKFRAWKRDSQPLKLVRTLGNMTQTPSAPLLITNGFISLNSLHCKSQDPLGKSKSKMNPPLHRTSQFFITHGFFDIYRLYKTAQYFLSMLHIQISATCYLVSSPSHWEHLNLLDLIRLSRWLVILICPA